MPKVITESITSREISFTEDGENGERRFWVYGVTTPTAAATAPGVPQRGQAFPDKPGLVAVSHSAELIEGHSDLCLVVVAYRNTKFHVGKVTYERNTTANFEPIWRSNVAEIGNGNYANNNTTDIGGVKVDFAGEPISQLRRQFELQITENLARNEFDAIGNLNFIGTRNNSVWRAFPAGTMLYMGARSTGAYGDDVEMVQHRFLYDDLRHLQQHPLRDAGGNIILDENKTAKTVVWRQPYPYTTSFDSISTNF